MFVITRTNNIYSKSAMLLCALLAVACTDELNVQDSGQTEGEKHTGEPVFFSTGTTENSASTRAATYYMEPSSHFVCQMYFKTDVSGELYDMDRVQTAWLNVEDWRNVSESTPGNSLYWKSDYSSATSFDKYRNDNRADIFYWQNRREHAFLAWTDNNKLGSIAAQYDNNEGNIPLVFEPYAESDQYPEKTSEKENYWKEYDFEAEGITQTFETETDFALYVKSNTLSETVLSQHAQQIALFSDMDNSAVWSTHYVEQKVGPQNGRNLKVMLHNYEYEGDANKNRYRWAVVSYFDPEKRMKYSIPENRLVPVIIGETTYYQGTNGYVAGESEGNFYSCNAETRAFLLDENGEKIPYVIPEGTTLLTPETVAINYTYYNDDTTPVAVLDPEDHELYACNNHHIVLYDETTPTWMACAKGSEVEAERDKVVYHDAKKFDLTRGEKTQMADQPDILLAYVIDHVPKSAVMEANRVTLPFKHQFSQVQVNLTNAKDNDQSVTIQASQIDKIELLGVSETGYVFPYFEYDEQNTLHLRPATYEPVDLNKFGDDDLLDNPFGTSFRMFDRNLTGTTDEGKYVKSYEAIAFGQLQAIRITWHELPYTDINGTQKDGVVHVSTYRVPEKDEQQQALRLLESGVKYIWNMELRRGTLAVIRTELIPWIENTESYSVDGIITPTPSGSSNSN